MSKADRKKETDGEVLRAGDIVPPYEPEGGAGKKKISRKKASVAKKTSQIKAKRAAGNSPAEERGGSDIPKLDLDRQILAEQRKVTSVRRKGPGAKATVKLPVKAAEVASERIAAIRAVPELAERDRVIAEIVARDIRKLCEE